MNDREMMKKLLISGALVGATVLFTYLLVSFLRPIRTKPTPPSGAKTGESEKIEKFNSEQEFKDYLAKSQITQTGQIGFPMMMGGRAEFAPEATQLDSSAKLNVPLSAGGLGGGIPQRVSETNVQVRGIDEPDIVKTDGKEIYFSQEFSYWTDPRIMFEAPMPTDASVSAPEIYPREMQA